MSLMSNDSGGVQFGRGTTTKNLKLILYIRSPLYKPICVFLFTSTSYLFL